MVNPASFSMTCLSTAAQVSVCQKWLRCRRLCSSRYTRQLLWSILRSSTWQLMLQAGLYLLAQQRSMCSTQVSCHTGMHRSLVSRHVVTLQIEALPPVRPSKLLGKNGSLSMGSSS